MKKDEGIYLVQDFRALNNQSCVDEYLMKDVRECIGEISQSGCTIDLTSGFSQMIVHPWARPYTAFTVPGMSPMGLLRCPANFQHLIETVVKGFST